VLPLISLHDELMRTGNKIQAINVRKLLRNVLAKGIASTPWRYSPAASVAVKFKTKQLEEPRKTTAP
jgi:hypothetical protein